MITIVSQDIPPKQDTKAKTTTNNNNNKMTAIKTTIAATKATNYTKTTTDSLSPPLNKAIII